MGKREALKSDASFISRCLGIGQAWHRVSGILENQRPNSQIFFKSFSVRRDYGGERGYGGKYFVIVRGAQGASDVVKFRSVNDLANLGHVISDMIRSEQGWRADKWGTDGNIG